MCEMMVPCYTVITHANVCVRLISFSTGICWCGWDRQHAVGVCLFSLIPSYEITASEQALIITCIPLQRMSQSSILQYQPCQLGIQLSIFNWF